MPIVTCEECGKEIAFSISDLDIDESQPSGNHTTQHSGSGTVICESCGTETEVSCTWDELNDTGEILSSDCS